MVTGAFLEGQATSGTGRVVDPHSHVSQLVTRPALAVPVACTLKDAVGAMGAAGVSAVLVGELAGVVTERDLARALGADLSPNDSVERVMAHHPVTVSGDTSVIAAAALMLNEQIRHLVVEVADGPVGIVSIRDLLRVLLEAVDHNWVGSLRAAVELPSDAWVG
jgi:CBS domain-containing protein